MGTPLRAQVASQLGRGSAVHICRTARGTLSACAANCAVVVSANGGSGQAVTESRSGGYWPETARLGAIREVLIGLLSD